MAVGKGSLLRAANVTAGRKRDPVRTEQPLEAEERKEGKSGQLVVKEENTVDKNAADEAEEKVSAQKRSSGRKRTAAVQKQITNRMWVNEVSSKQLQDIPSDWRGPKYVKPNVSALAESISRCGIIEPLPVVQIEKDTYQLVGGSRRMDVVRMLGISEVPVVVLPGSTMEDAKRYYDELRPYSDAAQDTIHNAKFRTTALFGTQRIPEYLL